MTSAQKLGFYATPPHKCSYLSGREAITLFADPHFPKSMRLYSALMEFGFRRSGPHLYIPKCEKCKACISIRIPVDKFIPNRNHRRIIRKNKDLVITQKPAAFRQDHFDLYSRYLARRHAGGGMDNPTPASYIDFLTAGWAETIFYEMKLEDRLVAVAATDVLNNALSAVYTFYEPELAERSLGKYSIFYQIMQARLLGLKWLYLGYWIKDSQKMKYKSEFKPHQQYNNNEWHDIVT